ncbi:MAG: ABC transporter permease, partial [Blastocatellia bacterium]
MPEWNEEIRRRLAVLNLDPTRELEIVEELPQHLQDRGPEEIATGVTDWKAMIKDRLTGLNLAPEREAEIIDEMAQHLEERYRELRRGGVSDEEARRLASLEIGDASELARRLARVEHLAVLEPTVLGATVKSSIISDIWRDVRYAARSLAKARGFTLVAVLCLALGIGGTTTIFSIVKPVLLSRLPFKDADGLSMLFKHFHFMDVYNDRGMASGAEVLEWRASAHSLEQIEAFTAFQASLTGGGQPTRVQVAQVTPGLFSLLGVSPARGRLFSDGDVGPGNVFDPETGVPGIQLVALISDRVWRSEFGSDPQIIGRPAKLDGQLVNIIGVMPPSFTFPEEADIWTPVRIPNTDSGTFLN